MSKWRKKQLQEIAFLKPTETLKKGDIAPNIPMANIKEFQRDVVKIDYGEFRGGTKFRNGDTLLAKITPCLENGKTAFVNCLQEDEIGFGSTEFIVLRAKENIDERFLYYLSISPEFRKQAISLMEGTSGRKRVNENALKISDFLIPDFEEQRKIANILSAIDDKIQINNQINQELEAMAKTLYDYWFVQFDFPDQNGKPYKSLGGKMVYNPELKREIPEGWRVEKLGDVSQYVSEKVDSSELNIENYVGTDNMIADMGGIELTTSIPKSGTSTKFSVGDILISNIRPYFKKIWLSDKTGGCSADVLCIRTDRIIPKEFVYATLARDDFFNYDVAGSKGSKMPRGDKKHIMEYPIVFEFGVAEQYSKIVEAIYKAVHENNNQNQELTKLRDWLLPMLMNGQVKVE